MPLVHSKLTRSLSDFHGVVKDEVYIAFDDYIGDADGMLITSWFNLRLLTVLLYEYKSGRVCLL